MIAERHRASYASVVCAEIPRILGLGDRDPASRTFGCFDRAYWHYATADFPNARFQEVAPLLALLHRHDLPGNILFGRRVATEWARAAVGCWTERRHRDGSVTEAYPAERSFCATAFGFAAVTRTYLLLGLEPPATWQTTAAWLAAADNPDAANQVAAAAHGLANWGALTGERRWTEHASAKAATLCARQDGEGWFPEYGGADVGYVTLTIGQLARVQDHVHDPKLEAALERAITFVDGRIGDDGWHDPSAGSRRTQFVYPYGLVARGARSVAAHARGVAEGRLLHPGWLDDRYLVQLALDFLDAAVTPC